jgi:hypothetical protein
VRGSRGSGAIGLMLNLFSPHRSCTAQNAVTYPHNPISFGTSKRPCIPRISGRCGLGISRTFSSLNANRSDSGLSESNSLKSPQNASDAPSILARASGAGMHRDEALLFSKTGPFPQPPA